MAFQTTREALTSTAFFVQAFLAFCINGAINGVIAWITMSNWGQRKEVLQYPSVPVWRWSYELNSNGAMDVLLTTFFIAYFSVILGSSGVMKDVREKKCKVSYIYQYDCVGLLSCNAVWFYSYMPLDKLASYRSVFVVVSATLASDLASYHFFF